MKLAELARKSHLDIFAMAEIEFGRRMQTLRWGKTGNGAYELGQYLDNGEFDLNTTGWTATQATLASVAGGVIGNCLRITENGGTLPRAHQDIELAPGEAYELRIWAKAGTETDGRIRVYDLETLTNIAQLEIDPPAEWTFYILEFTTPTIASGTTSVRILLEQQAVASSGTTFYYDRAHVRKKGERNFPAEVHDVMESGNLLMQYFDLPNVDIASAGFYWDHLEGRLFVHTNDDDSPAEQVSGEPKWSYIALFMQMYGNKGRDIVRTANMIKNGTLDWWLTSANVEDWGEYCGGSTAIAREDTEIYNDKSAYSAKFTGDSANTVYLQQTNVFLHQAKKAMLRFKYKHSTGGVTGFVLMRDVGANIWLNNNMQWQTSYWALTVPNSTKWTTYEITFIVHDSYRYYDVFIGGKAALGSASMFIDDVEVLQYYEPDYVLPYLAEIPSVLQGVGEFSQPDTRLDFGTLRFNHPEYWARYRGEWLWHGRTARLWVGEIDEKYEDLAAFGTAITRNPTFGSITEIGIDDKQLVFEKLPRPDNRYDNSIPDESWRGRPMPMMLGKMRRILPPQIATDGSTYWRYQPSRTSFDSVTYALQSIDNVYKGETQLTPTTQYITNLSNGTIDVKVNPGSDLISVDLAGIDRSFSEIGGSKQAGFLSGLLLAIWRIGNRVNKDLIDAKSLLDLDTARKQVLGLFLKGTEMQANEEILSLLKISTVSHFFVNLEGKLTARYFDSDVPSDAPRFYMGTAGNDNKDEPRLFYDSEQCKKWIAFRSQFREFYNEYRYEESKQIESVGWEHGEHGGQDFDTALYLQLGAIELSENCMKMHRDPAEKLAVTLGMEAFLLEPFSKAYFTWKEKDGQGNEIVFLDETVFVITEIEKNLNDGTARITAIRDNVDWVWVFT